MAASWTNADGLQVPFGNYWSDPVNFNNRTRALNQNFGYIKQIIYPYDLSRIAAGTVAYTDDLNNDGTRDGFDAGDIYLPAYSSVLRVTLLVKTAAAGGTSITFGTYQKAGTAIAATGLITATEGVIANLDTVGARTYGAGALVSTSVETASVGAVDAYIALATVGTFTAGTGVILVDYVDTLGDIV
jgi:hypothetical protein